MKNRETKIKLLENNTFNQYQKRGYLLSKANLYNEIKDISYYVDIVGNDTEFNCCQQMKQAKKKQRQKIKDHTTFLTTLKGYTPFFITLTFDNEKLKNKKYIKDPNGEYITNKNGKRIWSKYITDKNGKRVWDIKDITKQDWDILRRKIFKYIGNNVEDLILNVDYGKEHERLHAHGIVIIKDTEYKYITDSARDKNGNIVYNKNGTPKKYKKVITDYLLDYENNVGFYTLEKIRFSSNNNKYNETQIAKLTEYINKLVSHSIKVKQSYITTKKNTRYQRYKVFCRDSQRIINVGGKISKYDYLINTYNAYQCVNDNQENEFNLRRIHNHEKEQNEKLKKKIKERANNKRNYNAFDGLKEFIESETYKQLSKLTYVDSKSCLNITPYQVRGAEIEKSNIDLSITTNEKIEQLQIPTI